MTTTEILALIRETTGGDNRATLAALQDGAALAAIGVTDADQSAVEEAHTIVRANIKAKDEAMSLVLRYRDVTLAARKACPHYKMLSVRAEAGECDIVYFPDWGKKLNPKAVVLLERLSPRQAIAVLASMARHGV